MSQTYTLSYTFVYIHTHTQTHTHTHMCVCVCIRHTPCHIHLYTYTCVCVCVCVCVYIYEKFKGTLSTRSWRASSASSSSRCFIRSRSSWTREHSLLSVQGTFSFKQARNRAASSAAAPLWVCMCKCVYVCVPCGQSEKRGSYRDMRRRRIHVCMRRRRIHVYLADRARSEVLIAQVHRCLPSVWQHMISSVQISLVPMLRAGP